MTKNNNHIELIVFPLAILFNSFSMTGLLLVFGIAGHPEIAADIGLLQGATLALFYAFSANARNLVLADDTEVTARRFMQTRLMLMLPLAIIAWVASVEICGVDRTLATVLILRRIAEWMGEIGLARHERMNRLAFAKQTLIAEITSLLLCIALPLAFGLDLAVCAIPWMAAPMFATRRMELNLRSLGGKLVLRSLLPHFGNTAVIGTSVYVFRVSITLLTDKVLAGELFTAFAIGGIIPTVFGQAFAPTLTNRFRTTGWPRRLLIFPVLIFILGIATSAAIVLWPHLSPIPMIGRSGNFWLATTLSFAGGGIMVVALTLKTRLIYCDDGREVFGPDLLANVLITTCVPFIFYLLGVKSLSALYLISACLSLVFFWGAGHGRGISLRWLQPILFATGAAIAMPAFFQIGGGLFHESVAVFDSAGSLTKLPIPISAVAVFAGIALLGNYATTTRTLLTFFFSALLLVTTALTVAHGNPQNEADKLILLAQFLLPMFGLILGEMYGAAMSEAIFERVALWILVIVLPAQLAATWWHGYVLPQANVFVFSIYQHLQYFPMIVTALTIMVALGLWKKSRRTRLILLMLLPTAMIHLYASMSISALTVILFGIAVFLIWHWKNGISRRSLVLLVVLSICCFSTYLTLTRTLTRSSYLNEMSWQTKFEVINKDTPIPMPAGVSDRLDTWHFYINGLVESPEILLFGHITPPDRNQYPSAHNYWLDVAYNFGSVSLLPLFLLMTATARLIWQQRKRVLSDPVLLGNVLATGYLLLIENCLKVGMRQPYPGILTFFIWGLLIARLRRGEKILADG